MTVPLRSKDAGTETRTEILANQRMTSLAGFPDITVYDVSSNYCHHQEFTSKMKKKYKNKNKNRSISSPHWGAVCGTGRDLVLALNYCVMHCSPTRKAVTCATHTGIHIRYTDEHLQGLPHGRGASFSYQLSMHVE